MIQWIQVASGTVVTILAVALLALRLEHRITIIETNIDWLIKNNSAGCERPGKNEKNGKVDSAQSGPGLESCSNYRD